MSRRGRLGNSLHVLVSVDKTAPLGDGAAGAGPVPPPRTRRVQSWGGQTPPPASGGQRTAVAIPLQRRSAVSAY